MIGRAANFKAAGLGLVVIAATLTANRAPTAIDEAPRLATPLTDALARASLSGGGWVALLLFLSLGAIVLVMHLRASGAFSPPWSTAHQLMVLRWLRLCSDVGLGELDALELLARDASPIRPAAAARIRSAVLDDVPLCRAVAAELRFSPDVKSQLERTRWGPDAAAHLRRLLSPCPTPRAKAVPARLGDRQRHAVIFLALPLLALLADKVWLLAR